MTKKQLQHNGTFYYSQSEKTLHEFQLNWSAHVAQGGPCEIKLDSTFHRQGVIILYKPGSFCAVTQEIWTNYSTTQDLNSLSNYGTQIGL